MEARIPSKRGAPAGDGVTVPDTFAARREAQSIQVYDRRSSGASEASCTIVSILIKNFSGIKRRRTLAKSPPLNLVSTSEFAACEIFVMPSDNGYQRQPTDHQDSVDHGEGLRFEQEITSAKNNRGRQDIAKSNKQSIYRGLCSIFGLCASWQK